MSRAARLLPVRTTAAVLVLLGGVTGGAAPASAAPDATPPPPSASSTAVGGGFYDPPATVTGSPGTVIRSEAMTFYLDPLRLVPSAARATRVMYVSRDRAGLPDAVTGTVLVPPAAWVGPGRRPVVGYAVGTQGLADRCAPSRQLAAGSEYEGAFVSGLLARGYAVALTDYEGLGTPGTHTYMTRVSQAHAVLDMVRAAQRLPGTGLPTDGPVLLAGYSQGGGATAAAVELAPAYAPELRVRGAVAGAVPADLVAVADHLDGGLYAAFALYAVAGLGAAYDLPLDAYLNPHGRQVIADVEGECVVESVAAHAFTRSSDLTSDGRTLHDLAQAEPFRTILDEQRLGRIRPTVPVLVTHSLADDVIPYAVGRGLAHDWCRLGADVAFSANLTPTHVGGAVPSFAKEFAFLEARVAGLPQPSDCWWL
ncbi:lipase family protein [Intrasporangium flavum]|uniref:lipase family protein n=1 Tax=Intrasporangium flavum TaxID=1428657 RepID=UPI001F607415|nr:lipase family protein [Intrasporangium flavum]